MGIAVGDVDTLMPYTVGNRHPPLPTDALVQEAADWLVKVGILNQAPDITGTICRL